MGGAEEQLDDQPELERLREVFGSDLLQKPRKDHKIGKKIVEFSAVARDDFYVT